jgi:hypothetical protein
MLTYATYAELAAKREAVKAKRVHEELLTYADVC